MNSIFSTKLLEYPIYFKKADNIKVFDIFKFELIDQEAHNRLIQRKKGTKLKVEDKIFLIKIMVAYKEEHENIKSIYNISFSKFHRLTQIIESNFEAYQFLEARRSKKEMLDNAIWSILENIVTPPQFPLTVKWISEEFRRETGLRLSEYKIRKYLKWRLGYRYKKGNNRPPKVKARNHQLAKGCFAWRLLKLLLNGCIISNWDESSFDREIRENYSWLPKRVGGSIIGEPIRGKSSLILSVFPNGSWIAMVQDGTINSQAFSFYLEVISKVIKRAKKSEDNNMKILIDNAAIHHSELTRNALKALKLDIIYLPPYTPEFAPVELWFKAIKSVMKKRYSTEKLNFSKETGVRAIISWISSISRDYIQRWWLETTVKLKEWVVNTLSLREKLKR